MTDPLAEALEIVAQAVSPHVSNRARAQMRMKLPHLVALAEELRRKDGIIEDLRRERIAAWDAEGKGKS